MKFQQLKSPRKLISRKP